jgi:hypothetical protein
VIEVKGTVRHAQHMALVDPTAIVLSNQIARRVAVGCVDQLVVKSDASVDSDRAVGVMNHESGHRERPKSEGVPGGVDGSEKM